jgi:HK97 family phage portal protein
MVPIARAVSTWQENRPLPKAEDYATLAEDGYRRNSIVYACVRTACEAGAEPELCVKVPMEDDEPAKLPDAAPIAKLLNRPNPQQGQFEMLDVMAMHLQIAGNAYVHKVRNKAGAVAQLWLLRPDRVSIVPDKTGAIVRYEHKIDESATKGDPLDPADVIHLTYGPDPLDDYYGLSPLVAAARLGDLDNNAVDMMRAFFLNAGVPLSMMKLKGRVKKEEREKLGLQMKEKFTGIRGWFNWFIGDDDVDIVQLGINPKDFDLSGVFSQSETRLAMTFGVPPILIGSAIGLERSTYANYREARRALWEGRLTSLFTRIGDKLTHGLAPECDAKGNLVAPRRDGGNLRQPEHGMWIEFDLSDVAALQEGATERRAWAVAGWNAGILTRNEARAYDNKPPVVDGDVFKASLDAFADEPAVMAESAKRPADERRELMAAAAELREAMGALKPWFDTVNGRDAA